MIDFAPDRLRPQARLPDAQAEALWAEHGWGLTGRQVAVILLVFAVACRAIPLVSRVVGLG